ncbi:MAG TPA: gamma-glutamylcyclotransferase family protein [Solirubrobacterales bacterium]|nr:gamma-glutamylcyclotransferase family protein [Solirubrobacterales bacterium]
MIDYVFGYASLVALNEPTAVSGRLHGFRRRWGVAMNNWEGGDRVKHWLDRDTGERPRVRVAYLDIYEDAEYAVNGLALPVDAERLAALDAREINFRRMDVTAAFERVPCKRAPDAERPLRVFTYVGLDAARERCRLGLEEGNTFVSRSYLSEVRRAFEQLGLDALVEFDRTTDPLPFPELNLLRVEGRSR